MKKCRGHRPVMIWGTAHQFPLLKALKNFTDVKSKENADLI